MRMEEQNHRKSMIKWSAAPIASINHTKLRTIFTIITSLRSYMLSVNKYISSKDYHPYKAEISYAFTHTKRNAHTNIHIPVYVFKYQLTPL